MLVVPRMARSRSSAFSAPIIVASPLIADAMDSARRGGGRGQISREGAEREGGSEG